MKRNAVQEAAQAHERRLHKAAEYLAAKAREAKADDDDVAAGDAAAGGRPQATDPADTSGSPLAGKPLPHLGRLSDPDWWIKGLIERENITGIAPAPFLLRKEDAVLDQLLDTQRSEREVRTMVEDFNRRVIEARRQLLGGPPVVTPTRDVDTEVARWRSRRAR